MTEPIVDELRRVRDAYAARFSHDIEAMFLDIKDLESQSGVVFVDGVGTFPRGFPSIHRALKPAGNPGGRPE
jgi:hypothetical protein